jgi:pimeloyl-ACP methyl ester carboxylesterase
MLRNVPLPVRLRYFWLAGAILLIGGIASVSYRDIPVAELKSRYAGPPSRFLTLDGMEVHYRDEGQGPALVLLHGTAASLHTWNDWAEALTDDYRVIRMDLPAFGLTGPHPERDYRIASYVAFVEAFRQALGLDSFHLAGNSLGGHIAWRYALDHPAAVRKLVLIDAAGYPNPAGKPWVFRLAETPVLNQLFLWVTPRALIRKNLEEVYFNDELISDSLVTRYHEMALRTGNRQAFIDRARTRSADRTAELPNLRTPTLVLWGADDRWIPLANGERLVRDLPDAELAVLPATGHVPMEERPRESVAAARAFLDRP